MSRLVLRVRSPLACLVLALCAVSAGAALRQSLDSSTSDDIYHDCSDVPSNMSSGVYTLQPGSGAVDVEAYCDMTNDGGGWTVVIRRDDILPRENFTRDWESFKSGFGELDQEFYWGNEKLWMLTSDEDRQYEAHFWLEDWDGNTRYALYQNFEVESEAANYTLHVGEYTGDAGDNFAFNSNCPFTTYDRDNDSYRAHNCAVRDGAAWWHKSCTNCQLTGVYYEGGYTGNSFHGIRWYDWKPTEPFSLKAAVMKIRPSEIAA